MFINIVSLILAKNFQPYGIINQGGDLKYIYIYIYIIHGMLDSSYQNKDGWISKICMEFDKLIAAWLGSIGKIMETNGFYFFFFFFFFGGGGGGV